MKILVIMAAMLILASAAFAQVDTLMLVEDNSIEVPDSITNVYVENITDSSKAIFISTGNYIYAYDSQSLELIWTSPVLANPRDLQFADIDNDGFTDISVRDNFNLNLFDIINDQIIWTRLELDSTYKCYAIGDANNDSFQDIMIAIKEPFTGSWDWYNADTVWLEINYGPEFICCDSIMVLMNNRHYWDGRESFYRYQWPYNISTENFFNQGENITRIALFSKISIGGSFSYYWWNEHYGAITFIDAVSLDSLSSKEIGELISERTCSINDQTVLYIIALRLSSRELPDGPSDSHLIAQYSFIDTLITDTVLMYLDEFETNPAWRGIIEYSSSGDTIINELCFGINDTIFIRTFPGQELLNSIPCSEPVYTIVSTYNYTRLFPNTNIICAIYSFPWHDKIGYNFYDKVNGLLSGFLPYTDISSIKISNVNNDNNDEILSINGNILRICHLDYYIDIDEPVTIPYSTYLQPNYPNPFNAITTFKYCLADNQHVTIGIFDLLGRKVATIVDEEKPAGQYQAIWHAKDVPSGVYFYKITAGDYGRTGKMVLLK